MGDSKEWVNKDVECSASVSCEVWTRITVPKGSTLKSRQFICGFCSFQKDSIKQKLLEKQEDEIKKLKEMISDKLEGIKAFMTEKLDELKVDFQPSQAAASSVVNGNMPNPPKSTSDRHLNLVMFGCEEEKADSKKRFEELNQTVKTNLEEIEVDIEQSVTDFFRRGKWTPGKNRPIILRVQNIWEKRKILSGFRSFRATSTRNPSFTIREDHPFNPSMKRFREEAKKINEDLKKKAIAENSTVTKSYSAREYGIVLYTFKNGKWQLQQEQQ